MKKKILLVLIMICSLIITGCGNSSISDNDNSNNDVEQSSTVKTNSKIGDLSFYITSGFSLNSTSTDTMKVYSLSNDLTNISIWFVQKKDVSDSVETYMENDNWSPDIDSMTIQTYNGHDWYVQTTGELKLYTKYNQDIYAIRFSVLEDRTNFMQDLSKVIPRSLVFDK